MEKIECFNCERLCNERYCNKEHTHFCNIELANMQLHLAFCQKHAEEFEFNLIESLKGINAEELIINN